MAEVRTEKVKVPVGDGTTLDAFVARPERRGPGLIVIQEIFGVNAHIRDVTQRLAREGYLAVAPELFHRGAPGFEIGYEDAGPGMTQLGAMTAQGAQDDLKAAYEWLRAEGAQSSGAIGFCLGGRMAFLANSLVPLKCAVSFYGGRIAPDLLPCAKDQGGPLLLFWGGQDKHIPPEQRRSVADALRAAGKTFVDVEFGAADHGFFCDARASYEPAAAEQAWALTKAFLKRNLSA